MAAVSLTAALSALGLWLLFHQWRTPGGAAQFVLGIFPAALLLVTLPIPFAVWELMQAFQGIAEQGGGGVGVVAPFCLGIARASRLGSAGFLAVMGTAAVLQVFAMRALAQPKRTDQDATSRGGTWPRAILITSTLLAIPVALLAHLANEIPRLVMRVGMPDGLSAGETVQQVSETIASQSVSAVLMGALLSAIIAIFAIANIVAARSGAALDSLTRFSWASGLCGASYS